MERIGKPRQQGEHGAMGRQRVDGKARGSDE